MHKKIAGLTSKLVLALFCLCLAPHAFAQYDNGSVLGVIKDSSGAPIANATVTVTNTATGIVSEVKTNGSGNFEVPTLKVGVYRISATAPGFSDAVAENITISINERQRIDLGLKVGGTTTEIEVSNVAVQIETESSERGQVITGYQSAALPLVSRNYSDLLGLVTGVRQAPSAALTTAVGSLLRAGAYNVNGQRSVFNNFLLDGLDNNSYGESNQGFDNQIIAVPPDSVSQFSVVTNNESAEYGRSSGATINVATQSGTRRFHALAYEFIRNTDLNAAGYFKPTLVSSTGALQPFKKSTFNRNQYGVNFGGPVYKNKVFFFVDYEGFRQVLRPLTVLTLPTQNELNGILVVPVKNAVTGVVYPAGQPIPTSAFDSTSLQIVNFFKQIPGLPVSGAATTGLASNDYAVQQRFTDNADKGDLRLDYQQSPNSSWFLRVSDRKEDGVNYPTIPEPLDGQGNGKTYILDQQAVLGYTHLFGANKVLDARVGISRTKAGKYTLSIGQNSILFPGLPTNPVVAGGLPSLGITGFSGFGRQSTNPQWQNPALLDPKVNFTYVKGRHSLKFGYEYEHLWEAVNDNNPLFGSFTYGGGFSNAGGSTVSDTYFADFLFGTTSAYSAANYFVVHLRQTLDSAYAQDDWKLSNKLTVNLGLRWEYGSPYSEQNGYVSNFDPSTQTVLTTAPGAVAGNGITPVSYGGTYGKTLVNPDWADFAPRVGFAYGPDSKTSIRGGFGLSYVHYTRAGSGDILAINAPQAQFASVSQIAPTPANHCVGNLPAQIIAINTTTESCYATAAQGFPSGLTTTFNPATDNITYIPKNTRDSYVESFYLSIQRSLFKNSVLDVAYVGNHGLKLQGFLNANQLNPGVFTNGAFTRPYGNWPSDITEALNEFTSNYNALQVRYEQQFVAGLTLLNSFTWEHAIDNASASLEGNTPSPQDGTNLRGDYAQSDYNLPIINTTSLVYELPFGRGKMFASNVNSAVNELIGGWQISAINTAQAGTPFNLTYSPNSKTTVSKQISATFRGLNEYRPNIVPGVPLTQGRSVQLPNTGYIQYVNYAAIALPPTSSTSAVTAANPSGLLSPFGNESRNPGRTPAFYQTDLALNKKFATPIESLKVEFRTEAYNIFNHTNLYLPSSGLGGTLGGTPSSGGTITSTFEPRILQFGLKVIY